jgi:hypothetical protein
MRITREQRYSLKRVFDRSPLFLYDGMPYSVNRGFSRSGPMTYRQFRKLAITSFGCVMIPWCGMWLGIEIDGYTHS